MSRIYSIILLLVNNLSTRFVRYNFFKLDNLISPNEFHLPNSLWGSALADSIRGCGWSRAVGVAVEKVRHHGALALDLHRASAGQRVALGVQHLIHLLCYLKRIYIFPEI